MKIMGGQDILSLGQASSGTVDGPSYNPADLAAANEDVVRTPGSSASFAIPLASGTANGFVLFNNNLQGGLSLSFSGLGSVTTPAVPGNGVSLNAWGVFTGGVSGSTTLSVTNSGGLPFIAQLAMVGIFRDVRSFPPDSDFSHRLYEIEHGGEYDGLSYDLGADGVGSIGGTVFLTTAEKDIVLNAFYGSKNNSRPTAVILGGQAFVVKWSRLNTRKKHVSASTDIWTVDISWIELPREEHPI